MRIIAGSARGRTLKSRDGKSTRPTDARTREALFNILGERTIDAAILDLYAGTGAIGLEALSRGARSCTFVEQNAIAGRIIRENATSLALVERSEIWIAAVRSSLARLLRAGARFDIVFADPPFVRPSELGELCTALDNASPLLHNGSGQFDSLLVIQHHRKAVPVLTAYRALQERVSGESVLSFYVASK